MTLIPSQPAITLLMPVYNGSQHLHETIISILEQSFSNFEIICIDDSSTDDSYEIIQKFASIDSRLRLFQKPNEGIVPKALNFVLPYVKGEYVFYISQDDLMSKDLLEKLYIRAKETGADGILPDMIWYYADGNDSRGIFGQKDKIITGREAAALSIDWSVHGFVLWKSSLVQRIKYYEFSINSDEYTTRVLFLNSKSIAFCDGRFFYRQNNPNAITKKFTLATVDILLTNEKLISLFNANSATVEERVKLANRSFLNFFFLQDKLFGESGKLLSKRDRRSAQRKIKIAYKKNLKDIKITDLSLKFRYCFTNGYYFFVLLVWMRARLKDLIFGIGKNKK